MSLSEQDREFWIGIEFLRWAGLLQLLLIYLKVTGALTWHMLLVLAPILVVPVVILIGVAIAGIVAAVRYVVMSLRKGKDAPASDEEDQ